MAASSDFWSVVGGWISSAKPANSTIPTCRPELFLRIKDKAASLATSRRLGGMSVEHMLKDTSMARITVARLDGMKTVATGRPSAKTRLVIASRNKRKGKCLRSHDWWAAASRTKDKLE